MLTFQEIAALPDDDPRKIVDRIRSQQTRAAASRRLVFDYDDAAAAEILARIVADARRVEREKAASKAERFCLDYPPAKGARPWTSEEERMCVMIAGYVLNNT